MATKLYVGKLAYSTTEQTLQEEFAKFGTVISAHIIKDRETGQSKGFGFVEMERAADADAAIQALNGNQLDNRTVVVNVARELEKRPFGGPEQRSYRR